MLVVVDPCDPPIVVGEELALPTEWDNGNHLPAEVVADVPVTVVRHQSGGREYLVATSASGDVCAYVSDPEVPEGETVLSGCLFADQVMGDVLGFLEEVPVSRGRVRDVGYLVRREGECKDRYVPSSRRDEPGALEGFPIGNCIELEVAD